MMMIMVTDMCCVPEHTGKISYHIENEEKKACKYQLVCLVVRLYELLMVIRSTSKYKIWWKPIYYLKIKTLFRLFS